MVLCVDMSLTLSLSLSMDLAGYQRKTVPSLQFPFGGDPGT